MRHRARFILALATLLLATLLLGGCGLVGGLAYAINPPKIPAAYELQDRSTLVLVEDPQVALGSPALTGLVAVNVAHHLRQNKVVVQGGFVPEHELSALRNRLGREYARTPIDELGRLLGADQVIYVRVQEVTLQTAPTFYRPTATLDVKLIDAREGRRLFPRASASDDLRGSSLGHPVKVELYPRDASVESQGVNAVLARQLAERIGLEVARLFFEHERVSAFE